MRIRAAAEEDAEAIARGEAETARTPGLLVGRPGETPLSAYREKIAALAREGCYLVVEEGGALIAHAFLEPMPMIAVAHVFFLTIVVHPGHTQRGVGTALMGELLDWARADRRVEKVELMVRATNEGALRLYTKLGFVEEGRRRRRIRTPDGGYIDDVAMAWFPERP